MTAVTSSAPPTISAASHAAILRPSARTRRPAAGSAEQRGDGRHAERLDRAELGLQVGADLGLGQLDFLLDEQRRLAGDLAEQGAVGQLARIRSRALTLRTSVGSSHSPRWFGARCPVR
jgi:hypothetical protein